MTTTPLAVAPSGRRRRPTLLAPEPPSPPPPPWDLTMVTLPPWLMPMLRELMEVAERSFGPGSGRAKHFFVEQAVLDALVVHPTTDTDAFAPSDFRRDLVDVLIEAMWSLQFRRAPLAKSVLQEALDKVKHLGARLSEAREQGFIPS